MSTFEGLSRQILKFTKSPRASKHTHANPTPMQMVSSVDYRDPTMMLVLSILVGGLGVDRFMLGDTGLGVLKLITGGGLGIWWLIDIFTVENRAKEYNMEMFNEAIQNAKYMLPSAN